MSKTVTGYIVGVFNPNFSGLATVQIASRKDAYKTKKPGKITTAYIEAGYGVRQLVSYFGSFDALKADGPTTRLRFTMDSGLISDFSPA